MTRPTDIPQGVWDAALRLVRDSYIKTDMVDGDEEILAADVARSVMAEREACAEFVGIFLADEYGYNFGLPDKIRSRR